MTAGPIGGITAASRGHLRAAHADREQAIDTLKAAFVQGRLTKDEFDARLGQTFAARTYADLAAVTGDIPAGLASVTGDIPAGLAPVTGDIPAGLAPVTGDTPAGLAPVTGDIPAGLALARPPREPVRTLTRAEKAAVWGMYGIVVTVMLTIAVVPGPTTIGPILATAAAIYSVWLLGGLLMVASHHGWPRPQARGGASLPPRG